MEKNMLVSGRMIKRMGRVFTITPMAVFLEEVSGEMTFF